MTAIYLDHNATTPLHISAKKMMLEAMEVCGNPSSTHQHGRTSRQYIESARLQVAQAFAVNPAQVIFTSGATEANNLILKGFTGSIIVSAIEHDSILKAREDLIICPVTSDGIIELDALQNLLRQTPRPCLVSVMSANNETGVIQPLEAIVELCRQHQTLVHSDAVQILGKIKIDWQKLNLDYISVSAHKIGGPQGVGALIINPTHILKPQLQGGGQERYFRAGTENIIGIAGFGAAIEECQNNDWSAILSLRDEIEAYLGTNFDVNIFGSRAERLPNTVNLTMPEMLNNVQLIHFDLHKISISAGSACSSGKVKPSHVLQAMGIAQKEIDTSIRLSLGLQTKRTEIQSFIQLWEELYYRNHNRSFKQ